MTLASRNIPDLHLVGAASGTQCLPLYRYTAAGDRVDNITDWALAQFRARYPDHAARITKHAIFHYVYAVLHHPAYRAKYERNLKRELPRIPFYDDFPQWAAWGEQLMALHLDYEQVAPYPLAREDRDLTGSANLSGLAPEAAPDRPQGGRRHRGGRGHHPARRPGRSVGVPAGHLLGAGMGAGAPQRAHAQGPDHPREVQHLPVCRLQGAGHRPAAAA